MGAYASADNYARDAEGNRLEIAYSDGAWFARFLCLPFETPEEKEKNHYEDWPRVREWNGDTLASTVKRFVDEGPKTYQEWLADTRWDDRYGGRYSIRTKKPYTENDWNVVATFLRDLAKQNIGFSVSW